MTKLDELMRLGGQMPYSKSVKAKVVAVDKVYKYVNEKKEEKTLLNAAICDDTKAVKCTIYDASKYARFKTGGTVILRNIIKKQDGVVVTSASKVFPGPAMDVPDDIAQAGRDILDPPPAAIKDVSEALASPPKVRVSVRGRIVGVRFKFSMSSVYSGEDLICQ